MLRLRAVIDDLRDYNREIARLCCALVDDLRQELTPFKLERAQEGLQIGLLEAEAKIRSITARKKRRAMRLRQRCERKPELWPLRNLHDKLLALRVELLERQRQILLQAGDACAWIVLGAEPRVIGPLFSSTTTQHFPEGLGGYGPTQIRKEAHESGSFFVLQCDLTRCLGIGDLVIVPSNGRWTRPLVLEAKTKGEYRKGAEIQLNLIGYFSNHPRDREIFEEFKHALGFEASEGVRLDSRAERQIQALEERGDLLLAATQNLGKPIAPPPGLWNAMRRVIHAAGQRRWAFDQAESGIIYFAIRNLPGDDPNGAVERLLEGIREMKIADRSFQSGRFDVLSNPSALTALIPPIPLWNLPPDPRVSLLCGEVFFSCLIDPKVWDRAFAARGIGKTEEAGGWMLKRGEEEMWVEEVEVRKLTTGASFGAFSPSQIAASAEAMLRNRKNGA